MTTRCDCCHVEKDRTVLEAYPFEDDCIDATEPVDPILEVEVSGPKGYRLAKVCHECVHNLKPDMWASMEQWEAIHPKTAYGDLSDVPLFGANRTLVDEESGTVTFTGPNSFSVMPLNSPIFKMTNEKRKTWRENAMQRFFGLPDKPSSGVQ